MASKKGQKKLYDTIIADVFLRKRPTASKRFPFSRDDLRDSAAASGFELSGDEKAIAKNLGDIVYSYRFRKDFPEAILATAPKGKMWIIVGVGAARYEFRLITQPSLAADPDWFVTKIHDSTPEIVRRFPLADEQAVLARIRYNRLIDLFCRCIAFSLQNHLRTSVAGIGQIEIDELYVGANRTGEHYIIPVQVKRAKDRLGVSQLLQDLAYCREEHADMQPRAIGAQMGSYEEDGQRFEKVILFEFECEDTDDDVIIRKIAERHFVLLPYSKITSADLLAATQRVLDDPSGA